MIVSSKEENIKLNLSLIFKPKSNPISWLIEISFLFKILEPEKSLFLTMLRFLKSSFLYPLKKIPLEIFSLIIIPSPLLLIIKPSI